VSAGTGISVVTTVRDDREALRELLDALERQSRRPDEVVVVDAGSQDGTIELLERRRADGTLPISIVSAAGANISAGRNVGIRRAAHDRIACTDAGCIPAPQWLAAFATALESADFAAGVFRVDARTPFEQCLAAALYPDPAEIGDDRAIVTVSHRLFGRSFGIANATGRSMAFSRAAWERAGGFPEELFAGEDVAFSAAMVRSGVPATLVPSAEVCWRPRPTWIANAWMYAVYARGDVRRTRRRYGIRLLAYAGGPALLAIGPRAARIAIAAGAAGYLGLPLARARRAGVAPAAAWRIPALVAMKDAAQITGAAQGLFDLALGRPQPVPGG
jgi:glycosyltransferase involved in cell wall biosynthesis